MARAPCIDVQHVRDYVGKRLQSDKVKWMIPIKPFDVRNPCTPDALHTCLNGFAIQVRRPLMLCETR